MPRPTHTVAVTLCLVLLASSCVLARGPQDGPDELASMALGMQDATFTASYQFSLERDLAPGVTTTMEIVQQPPTSLRRLDTSTRSEDDGTVTVTSWHIRAEDREFTCTAFDADGVRCQANPLARGTFGSEKLDEFFDMPRDAASWEEARRAVRTVRIEGEPATCFEAVPAGLFESPEEGDERFRYELCYAEDGILLRGTKTTTEGTQVRSVARVEIVSLSRVVAAADLQLPGPVVDPSEVG
jgi:hypothetical protein